MKFKLKFTRTLLGLETYLDIRRQQLNSNVRQRSARDLAELETMSNVHSVNVQLGH